MNFLLVVVAAFPKCKPKTTPSFGELAESTASIFRAVPLILVILDALARGRGLGWASSAIDTGLGKVLALGPRRTGFSTNILITAVTA